MLVRSSMLPTGKAHQDALRRLFSKPGAHIFKDATIPISLVGPHVIASLFSPPYNKSLEVSFLLSKAISGCDESEITNLLKSATGFGNSYFVSALIDAGADIINRDSNGESVISLAVQSGNIDSVQVLIESGFVIDHSIDRFLHDAAVIDRADIMELLFLGFGDIDVNSIDSQGRTALHVAAIHGHVEVLHCAASEGRHEVVEFLLYCSMFVKYAVNEDGKTAFALAVEKGHSHLYDILHLGDALHRAARIDDVHAIKSCIAEGVNVNRKDQNGCTALHRAAFKGRIESVKTLVSNGAQIDLLDDGGYTPLCLAVEGGHMQIAMYLIAHGAKANVVKNNSSLKEFEMVPFNLNCFKNHPSLVTTPLCREKERA